MPLLRRTRSSGQRGRGRGMKISIEPIWGDVLALTIDDSEPMTVDVG